MKISDIEVTRFKYVADRWDSGHGRLLKAVNVAQTVTVIHTDAGVDGCYFGGGAHGDGEGLSSADRDAVLGKVKELLVGQNPLDREMIWKWLWIANTQENVASVIDNALWDLAGNYFNAPCHALAGGAGRSRIRAYASTYPNIGQPRTYADYAIECKKAGYTAFKIHPHYFWNPETQSPTPGRPSNIKADIETCHLVREAVGPGYVLMYDPWGTYMTMEDAVRVGRELEALDFYWYEQPMPEYRVASYVKLAQELSIPILAPEVASGGVFTRADWIAREASDMSRIDVMRGGITGARKTCVVAEAFGQRCEIHMAGWGNLQVIAATHEDTSEYYEKGLMAPGVDYDAPLGYLKETCDKINPDGTVNVPRGPGLGYGIEWDYIADNTIGWGAGDVLGGGYWR